MAAKDLNKCAKLLTDMLDKDMETKTKRKIASGKPFKAKAMSETAKSKINRERKPKLPIAARRKPVKGKAKSAVFRNKENEGRKQDVTGSSTSSYEVFKKPANVPEPLNDTDKVKQFQPQTPEKILRPAENVQETRTPFNNRLMSSTPAMSPVSLRVVGKDNNMYATSTVPILNRSPNRSHYSHPASSTMRIPSANFSLYSGSSIGNSTDFNRFVPKVSAYTGYPRNDAISNFEIPTRDDERPNLAFNNPISARPMHYQENYNSHRPQIDSDLHLKYLDPARMRQTNDYTLETGNLSDLENRPGHSRHIHFKDQAQSQSEVVPENNKNISSYTNPPQTTANIPKTSDFGVNTSLPLYMKPEMENSQSQDSQPNNTPTNAEREMLSVGINTSDVHQTKDTGVNTSDAEGQCDENENPGEDKPARAAVPAIELTPRSQEGSEWSSQSHLFVDPKSKEHMRNVRHLLTELSVLAGEDSEAARLVKAIDGEFEMLVPGNPASLQWQNELNMALQPIRNENAQLRRRVRILNHQLQEKERLQKSLVDGGNHDFDVVHLQLLNHNLEQQMSEDKKLHQHLVREHHMLKEEIAKIASEKQELLKIMQNKDIDVLKLSEEIQNENRQLKHRIMEMEQNKAVYKRHLETQEHDANIRGISMAQKDKEISRLQDLVRSLHQSMTRLVGDLEKCKPQTRAPWTPTMDNLTKIKQLLNESQLDRNDIETELHGPLQCRPVRPHTPPTEPTEAQFTPKTLAEMRTPATTAPSGVSFSERVTAAFSSIPNPVLTSGSNSQSSTLTQEMLRDHDKLYVSQPGLTKLQQYANERTDDLGLETQTISTITAPVRDNYVHNDITAPRKEENIQNDTGSMKLGESFADTDYMVPPGFTSPVRKFVKEANATQSENGPTVRDLLSSLASRWQKSANGETTSETVTLPKEADPKADYDSFSQSWPVRKTVQKPPENMFNDTVPSVEQSRYSVTEYFKKYSDLNTERKEPNKSVNISQNSTLVSESDRKMSLQMSKLKETDISLSIISENASEVSDITVPSVATSSTSTVDEQAFWEGLDQLDADIAMVQQSLKKKMHS